MISWIDPLFPFARAFQYPSVLSILPCFWIGLIIIFFLAVLSKFLINYTRCRTTLEDLNKVFSEYTPSSALESFEEISNRLSKLNLHDSVVHLWSEFSETFVKIKKTDGKEEIFNTIDAHYFFNEGNLIAGKFNLAFYKSVPGILTGLGILGTFLGLTFGLADFNVTSEDVNILKKGIAGLLLGAGAAFSTSVWGISLSIVFSVLKKHWMNDLDDGLSDLQNAIDKVFTRKTPEWWLSDILEESRQQSAELKKFNTDLAISIASALDEKLATHLTPTFDKLLIAIDELTKTGASEIAKTITEGSATEITKLNEVLSKVATTLETTVGESQEIQRRMGDTLNEHLDKFTNTITSSISETSNEISSLVDKVGEQTNDSSEEMRAQIETLSALIKSRTEEVSERFENERSQIDTLLRNIESTLKRTEDIVEEAGLVAESFGEIVTPVKNSTENLSHAVDTMKLSQEKFTETVESFQDHSLKLSHNMEQIFNHMKDALGKTMDSWEAYETNFDELRDDLDAVFEKLGEGLREYKEATGQGVIDYLSKLDDSLKKTVGLLAGAIEQLQETIEDMGEILPIKDKEG